jgi:methylated-DNA-[protein]-cysteine S-methyltransferase
MSLCVMEVRTAVGPLRLEADPRGLQRAAFPEPFLKRGEQARGAPWGGHRDIAVRWYNASAPDLDPEAILEAARVALEGDDSPNPIPLAPVGTDFQRAVWQALAAIPPGRTRTYRAIAEALGRPSAARAVGAAVGKNPFAILVPCHRAVGSRGHLTGYAWGLERKAALLAREGATVL